MRLISAVLVHPKGFPKFFPIIPDAFYILLCLASFFSARRQHLSFPGSKGSPLPRHCSCCSSSFLTSLWVLLFFGISRSGHLINCLAVSLCASLCFGDAHAWQRSRLDHACWPSRLTMSLVNLYSFKVPCHLALLKPNN